jgi:hypothetical protein
VNKHYALGTVKDLGDAGDFPGTFEVILSTPELDRDGEVIEAKAFEPLPEFVSFDIDHGMSVATTVASGTPRYDGDKLKVRGTWSSIPEAQKVRTLVREGHVRFTSVAFMAPKYETKDGVPTITKAEILNGAFTPIPSNRGAEVIAAKSFDAGARTLDAMRPMFKGHGLTASVLSQAIERAIEEKHGGERVYTYLRDYTDEWAVFSVYSMNVPTRMLQQTYEVKGNEATMTGDPIEVVAKVVYEPVKNDEETRTAPTSETVEKTAPDAETVAALAQARLVVAQASATLALTS